MAVTVSPAEAVAALQDIYGPQLDATREEGHEMMIDALRKRFSIAKRDARELVEELEQARTIRYRPGTRSTGVPGGSPTARSGAEMPILPIGQGSHWQLGSSN
jgi:hypothetical protein